MSKDTRLTNLDISNGHQDDVYWLFPSNLKGAFAYWVVYQNPNPTFIVDKPLEAFSKHIEKFFPNPQIPTAISYEKLKEIISDKVFESIPEIMELNEMKPDFIDLGALERNIFYMICREEITSGFYDKKSTEPVS